MLTRSAGRANFYFRWRTSRAACCGNVRAAAEWKSQSTLLITRPLPAAFHEVAKSPFSTVDRFNPPMILDKCKFERCQCKEKGESESHTLNSISKFTETRSSCDKIKKCYDNRSFKKNWALRWFLPIPKLSRKSRPSLLGGWALSPSSELSSSSISTHPSPKGEDLESSINERKIELTLSFRVCDEVHTDDSLVYGRILSRKYWAGGSAGPINGGQMA